MKIQPTINTLELRGLHKAFGKPVVHDLSLTVRRGEIYALLGPNGAGKTTCLRMAVGLLEPDAGQVRILGTDLAQDPVRAHYPLAYLPDEPLLYDRLTPWEYLEFVAGLWRLEPGAALSRAGELLHLLGLKAHAGQLIEGFSRGMKQKLALAAALLHQPSLIILDEPLTGLDTQAARQVKDMLVQHARSGGSVLLTTHILDVAEKMADRIGIVRNGKLVEEGTLAELRDAAGKQKASLEDIFLSLTAAI